LKKEIRKGSPGWWNIVEASGAGKTSFFVNAQNSENANTRDTASLPLRKNARKILPTPRLT